jgi:hypothetical protein
MAQPLSVEVDVTNFVSDLKKKCTQRPWGNKWEKGKRTDVDLKLNFVPGNVLNDCGCSTKDLIHMLPLPLNLVVKFLAAVESRPFREHDSAKNHCFFRKTSFLIVLTVIFKGKKKAAVIFAEWTATNDCAADRRSSLSFCPLSQNSTPAVRQVALDLCSLMVPCFPCLARSCGDRPVANAVLGITIFTFFISRIRILFKSATHCLLNIFF